MFDRLSDDQKKAVFGNGNIIVSAGAGSGKTTVMIERIIYKLLNGAQLSQMLIVTFTRAAAAELRVKLAKRLNKLKADAIRQGDKNALRAAQRAADDLPICNIGTLHSFCQRLIRAYSGTAEVDPASTVCDEGDAKALKRAAIRVAVDNAWKSGEPYFRAVYEALASRRNDDGVIEAVGNIMEFALSLAGPDGYINGTPDDAVRFAELDAIAADRREKLLERATSLRRDIAAKSFTLLEKVIGEVWSYLDGTLDKFIVTRVSKTKYDEACQELNERYKTLKDDCKDYREFCADAERAKTVDSAPYARALCAVAGDALAVYAARKRELGKIDYSDLEHGALKVLMDEACMREISDTVKYVFIDEYQDINSLQSEISNRLERNGAEMFLIGDIKQSIYGFRRCDPKYFRAKIEAAKRQGSGYEHIWLVENFRSSQGVIDFANGVFDGVMSSDFGGADYAEERLVCGGNVAGDECGLYRIPADPSAYDDEDGDGNSGIDGIIEMLEEDTEPVYSVVAAANAPVAYDPETEFIAKRILKYLDDARKKNPEAKVGFGSVAVLLRSARSGFCTRLARTFDEYGIKYNFGRKASVNDYPEAVALLDVLRCVDNRFDDIALYTAMRSAMGGFSDDELLEIAKTGESAARRKGVVPAINGAIKSYAFWQKVKAYDGENKDKVKAFYALRDEFCEYAKSHDCAEVLGYITASIDYFQHVYETGGQAQAVEALIAAAEAKRCDTYNFLAGGVDFELDFAGQGDAVTVTTVHSSKGLEYDFVIVADCAHKFRFDDTYSKVIVSDDGVAVKFPDAKGRKLIKSVPWMIENSLAPERLRAEELRLFYVALTRAKHVIMVCGKCKAEGSFSGSRREAATTAYNELDFMRGLIGRKVGIDDLKHEERKPQSTTPESINEALVEAVRTRCNFPYESDDLPIKTCVTDIAESDGGDDYLFAAPVLTRDEVEGGGALGGSGKRAGKSVTDGAEEARLRGTAYHSAMELIDIAKPDTSVLDKCENIQLVDEKEILKAAEVIRELTRNCEYVFKEKYFIVDVPCKTVYGGAEGGSVLVQGVIDLLAVTDGGEAIIVDYKTTAPEKLLCDEYKTQLRLYAAAVERSTPYKVKAKYLYSFVTGKLIEIA